MGFWRDCFTGPQNDTFAIGRVLAIPLLVTGLALPATECYRGNTPSLAEAGAYFVMLAGAVLMLLRGSKNIDTPDVKDKGTPQ